MIYEQVLISLGPRASGAVLKGVIPADERRVSDLLNSVKNGSVDALAPISTAPPPPDESPDKLESVAARIAAMPPIILGKDMADNLGER